MFWLLSFEFGCLDELDVHVAPVCGGALDHGKCAYEGSSYSYICV